MYMVRTDRRLWKRHQNRLQLRFCDNSLTDSPVGVRSRSHMAKTKTLNFLAAVNEVTQNITVHDYIWLIETKNLGS